MEKIVYLLGAGFSAPLGLPVMSNFLEKSKDLYFSNPQRYGYFEDVLKEIARMSVVKNYYSTDLFNIEEILSVLAMQQGLKGRQLKRVFLSYIADVITYYTPIFSPRDFWPSNWQDNVFSSISRPGPYFGTFVANLVQLRVSAEGRGALRASSFQDADIKYGVIMLNYDLVLENFVGYMAGTFSTGQVPSFSKDLEGPDRGGVPLAKLHGSADTGVMVAPTWNKTLARNLLPAWKMAFELLAQANHIRIIGYSLPTADAYIKYLLRAAAIESPHLKRIDVLCRDDSKALVRERYSAFIDFSNFRYSNEDVVSYLAQINRESLKGVNISTPIVNFQGIESAHEDFFRSHSA